nr:hypothetical protein [Tanacetum cinerariifolium]
MMVLYCQKSAAEDQEFGIRVNKLRGKMIVACEKRMYFVEELKMLSDVIATANTAVFLKETMDKDDGRLLLLHDLEKQAEEKALEKELYLHGYGVWKQKGYGVRKQKGYVVLEIGQNAFSCEVQALIRRISLVGYGVL